MSAEALLSAARTLGWLAIIVVLLQVAWMVLRQRMQVQSMVRARIQAGEERAGEDDGTVRLARGRYDQLLMKAGFQLTQMHLLMLVLGTFGAMASVAVLWGLLPALLVPVAVTLLVVLVWKIRYERRRRQIFETLPGLIDEMIRSIDAGRSLEMAIVEAFRNAPPVFERLAFRLRSAVDSGREFGGLFDDFAEIYQVPPLVFVAVAFRTSARFGSSIRPILKQVSSALRGQQEMRREFMAATAEIRFTAAAFAILPLAIAGFMMWMNPNFRDVLLGTSTGHVLLSISGGLIAIAVLIIFRMVQGVGRG